MAKQDMTVEGKPQSAMTPKGDYNPGKKKFMVEDEIGKKPQPKRDNMTCKSQSMSDRTGISQRKTLAMGAKHKALI